MIFGKPWINKSLLDEEYSLFRRPCFKKGAAGGPEILNSLQNIFGTHFKPLCQAGYTVKLPGTPIDQLAGHRDFIR